MLDDVLGEDREIRYILFDEKCEKLTFPKIFLKENLDILFHKNTINGSKISQSTSCKLFTKIYLKQWIYIYIFLQSFLQQKKSDQINMGVKKSVRWTKCRYVLQKVIQLKRKLGSCFINNYNPVLLKAWKTNLDIQPGYTKMYWLIWETLFQSLKVRSHSY